MSTFTWKEDQKKALEHNQTMALAASAGTGKTTILVEKYIRNLFALIEESPGEPERALTRMAAITFTELAAAEMKSRVRQELRSKIKEYAELDDAKSGQLQQVLKHFETARINTIHSFCRQLLSENYLEAGLPPGFQVLDETDGKEQQLTAAREAVSEAIRSSERIRAFAVQHGMSTIEENIIAVAGKLRADNKEELSLEEFSAWHVEYWSSEAQRVAAELQPVLNDYISQVEAGLATKPSAKKQQALETATKAREDLQAFFNSPKTILDADELPGYITEKKQVGTAPSGTGIDSDSFRPVYSRLRELLGWGDSNDPACLANLAGLKTNVLPWLEEIFSLIKDYIRRFTALKRTQDSLDFEDLLLETNALLKKNKTLLRRYQKLFRWIMVDESQDVNAVQMGLIQQLHGDGSHGNLFMVGDGKQSIYRFRHADVQLYKQHVEEISQKHGHFALQTNFRSHQKLISSFNAIFKPIFDAGVTERDFQIDYGEPLLAGRAGDYPASTEHLIDAIRLPEKDEFEELGITNKHRYEARMTARHIHALRGLPNVADTQNSKLDYRDFAILLRSFGEVVSYSIELSHAGIPHRVNRGKGFYQQREIWDLICYLKLVWFDDDYALLTVLRSPLCLLSDESLMKLGQAELLEANALAGGEPARLKPLVSADEWVRLERFATLFSVHRLGRGAYATADMLDQLLERTGFDAAMLARTDGDQRSANIRKLLEMSRSFEASDKHTPLEFVLELESRMFDDTDEAQAAVFSEEENHVQILTVHKSKGLEFPVVILPRMNYRGGRGGGSPIVYTKEGGMGASLPSEKLFADTQDSSLALAGGKEKGLERAENIRLFYVAATRARARLVLPWWPGDLPKNTSGDSWQHLLHGIGFYDTARSEEFGVNHLQSTDITPIPAQSGGMEVPAATEQEQAKAGELLARARLTSLPCKREIDCGVWRLINLLYPDSFRGSGQPLNPDSEDSAEDEQINRTIAGTLVHEWIEQNFGKGKHDSAAIEHDLSLAGMAPGELQTASDSLLRFIRSSFALELETADLIHEQAFSARVADTQDISLTVHGIIDLLALDGEEYRIVDFKYAHSKESPEYDLQMRIYAMACMMELGRPPGSATVYYLKDGVGIEVDVSASALEKCRLEIIRLLQSSPL